MSAAGAGTSPRSPKQGMAVASLALGILSIPSFGCLGVGAILGLTFGIIALVKANRSPAMYGGRGLAIAGIVTSVLVPDLMSTDSRVAALIRSTLAAALGYVIDQRLVPATDDAHRTRG